MKTDNFFVLFDIIMFAAGVYCLYSWGYMRRKGEIHDNKMTIPSDVSIASCSDPAGYMEYIGPRMLTFGVVCVIFGGVNVACNFYPLPGEVQFVCLGVLFANIIWFAFVIRRANLAFWPQRLL